MKYIVFNYYYFLKVNLRFQPRRVSNLMQKGMSFVLMMLQLLKKNDYRIHFWYMSKDEAIGNMNNIISVKKMDDCKI